MSAREASQPAGTTRPNVQMAFACESVESAGGTVSFRNVMDGIAAADFPATTGPWVAIFCFLGQEELTISNCRVIVTDEAGEIIAQTKLKDVRFTVDNQISRNVVRFAGLTWPHPGRYVISFVANEDDVLASFPMFVYVAPAIPGEADPQPQA